MGQFKKTYWLTALLTTILGFVLIIWPGLSVIYICKCIGAAVAICGIFNIVQYYTAKQVGFMLRFNLILGVLLCIIGIWLFVMPVTIIKLIPIIAGIMILFHGIVDFGYTFALKNAGYQKWQASLVMSILTIILAIVILLNAFETVEFLITLVGCALVFDGIKDLILLFVVGKALKQMQKGKNDLGAIDVEIIDEKTYRD